MINKEKCDKLIKVIEIVMIMTVIMMHPSIFYAHENENIYESEICPLGSHHQYIKYIASLLFVKHSRV